MHHGADNRRGITSISRTLSELRCPQNVYKKIYSALKCLFSIPLECMHDWQERNRKLPTGP